MDTVAATNGAVSAFDAYTLPSTCKLAPRAVEVLIPRSPVELNIVWVLRIDEMFMTVTMAFGAVTAFEAYKFPATKRAGPLATVPIPTVPVVPER